ncbi:hypothetical protein [uncultured Eudoraea sp.]|uniref:hypothetical protein n=1 Tax=uncultured Eudoraea sp. TaxID=1035614 RepID=UPI00262199B5|nr:hypothetical protein [uncultured Eudoraea sp.]
MKKRKIIASVLIIIALILGSIFFSEIMFPVGWEGYFKTEYYGQFGPLAICVELLIAGIYMFIAHPKTNFTMALFAFTVLSDLFFNIIGLITTLVPVYALVIFLCCAVLALWLAFSNAFSLGRISLAAAFGSFILGNAVELFFNYL